MKILKNHCLIDGYEVVGIIEGEVIQDGKRKFVYKAIENGYVRSGISTFDPTNIVINEKAYKDIDKEIKQAFLDMATSIFGGEMIKAIAEEALESAKKEFSTNNIVNPGAKTE